MIRARCVHTGEPLTLDQDDELFLDRGPGELARAGTMFDGEIGWMANGRRVRVLGARRTSEQEELQHDLADLETGAA